MKSWWKVSILWMIFFGFIVILLIFFLSGLVQKGGEQRVMLDPGDWYVLNGGKPIDLGGEFRDFDTNKPYSFDAVATDNYVYYFMATDEFGYIVGRFDLNLNKWELLTEEGWSGSGGLPKSMSLLNGGEQFTEGGGNAFVADLVRLFDWGNDEVFGTYHEALRVFSGGLDDHGGFANFLLTGEDVLKYSEGTDYDKYRERTLIQSWNKLGGVMAVGENKEAIAVLSYGHTYGSVLPMAVTAIKYDESWQDLSWKRWTSSGWNGGWNPNPSTYTPILPTDWGYQVRDFRYFPELGEYFLFVGKCVAKYSDAEGWMWWADEWTNDFDNTCTDLYGSDSLAFGGIVEKQNSFFQDGEVVFVYSSSDYSGLSEIVYDTQAGTFSGPVSVLEDETGVLSFFRIVKDSSGTNWIVYSLDGNILAVQRGQGGWTDPEVLLDSDTFKLKDFVFLEGDVPMLFVENSGKIYAYSTGDSNGDSVDFGLDLKYPRLDEAYVRVENSWENIQEDNSYAGAELYFSSSISGNMALDEEGNLYAPNVPTCSIAIHPYGVETDDWSDGVSWGHFWDLVRAPAGMDVDDTRGWVYIANEISASRSNSAGIFLDGIVEAINKSLNDEYTRWVLPEDNPTLTGGAGGEFKFPIDVVVDEDNGWLYVSDSMNHQIQKFDVVHLDGDLPSEISVVGNFGSGNGELIFPQAIDVDINDGSLYVADAGNHRIVVFDSFGGFLRSFGDYGIGRGEMLYPHGLAVDPDFDLVYVGDSMNKKVLIFSKAGEFLYSWSVVGDKLIERSLVGGIVAYGNGVFGVSQKFEGEEHGKIYKYAINDLTDGDSDGIPDVLSGFVATIGDCGDGLCEAARGEDCNTCVVDCGCVVGNELVCDVSGECVECLQDSDCASWLDCAIISCGEDKTCAYTLDHSICVDDSDCTNDVCIATYGCVNSPLALGTECSGGFCDAAGSCSCLPDESCSDEIQCTVDYLCDGVCENFQDDSLCDDGLECTGDFCFDFGGGLGCNNFIVAEGTECSQGLCDAAGNCVCSLDEDCDDGLYCTGVEICSEGACLGGSSPCSSGQTCDEAGDTCVDGDTDTGGSCFPAGTRVLMADGTEKAIEGIGVGEMVLSYNEDSGDLEGSVVFETEHPLRDHLCEVDFADGSKFKLTDEHPVYTTDGWKSIDPLKTSKENSVLRVGKLEEGDLVIFAGKRVKGVGGVDCWEETVQTYNLKEVVPNNDYFAEGVLVHNKGGGNPPSSPSCEENWTCTDWSECVDEIRSRVCTDENGCGAELDKPLEVLDCLVGEGGEGEEDGGEGGADLGIGSVEIAGVSLGSAFVVAIGTISALAVVIIVVILRAGRRIPLKNVNGPTRN
ncbi:MAG: 6-bladed beta-propeller [archaeon]